MNIVSVRRNRRPVRQIEVAPLSLLSRAIGGPRPPAPAGRAEWEIFLADCEAAARQRIVVTHPDKKGGNHEAAAECNRAIERIRSIVSGKLGQRSIIPSMRRPTRQRTEASLGKVEKKVLSVLNHIPVLGVKIPGLVMAKFPGTNIKNIRFSVQRLKKRKLVALGWVKLAACLLCVSLCGCRTAPVAYSPSRPPKLPPAATTPGVRAPLPPSATLTWTALPDMEAYRVDYGLTADNLTDSIVTSANTCTIVRDAGQYAWQVRGIYHQTYTPPIRSGVFEIK